MSVLTFKTENGIFDLLKDEKVVQSLSVFDFQNIGQRTSEYTNDFSLPLTSNNLNLINFANDVNTINAVAYKKISCDLLLDGNVYKQGFLEINSIDENINVVYYSGNGNFYALTKQKNLCDLDWKEFNHNWNLATAYLLTTLTDKIVYPVMNYGGQNLATNVVDVRKILPATSVYWTFIRIIEQLGYTFENNLTQTYFTNVYLPFSEKVLEVSAQVQLLNKVDLANTLNYSPVVANNYFTYYPQAYPYSAYRTIIELDYNVVTSASTQYNRTTRKFTASYTGVYDWDITVDMAAGTYSTLNFTPPIQKPQLLLLTRLVGARVVSGVETIFLTTEMRNDYFGDTSNTFYSTITMPYTSSTSLTESDSIFLNEGDELHFYIESVYLYPVLVVGAPTVVEIVTTPTILSTNTLDINLQPEIVFGGLITYSSILPKIKCSDFIRDLCVRYGIILKVNEFDKIVQAYNFDTVVNSTIYTDWSGKLIDNENYSISFKYDNYGRLTNFKHKIDKSISSVPDGSNYQLQVNNENLENEKDLYNSPFGVTENVDYNGYTTSIIDLYDTVKLKFAKNVDNRIATAYTVSNVFAFTDGTTTSAANMNNKLLYFIDQTKPTTSLGFSQLIPEKSKAILSVMSNLKIIKAKFKLNILDIINLDFLKPVWIEKYNALFFISQIKQYDYTEENLTEVELIKLN